MQVESFLELSAQLFPDKTALVCGDRRLSYREVEEQSNRLGHALIAEGVQRGDRVVVFLENSVEAVLSVFAILKAGGIFVMANPTTKMGKLSYLLRNSGARVLITDVGKLHIAQECLIQAPELRTVVVAGLATGPGTNGDKRLASMEQFFQANADSTRIPPKNCIDIDLAALIYTSGSTGNAKGVMVTHLNIVSAASSIIAYLDNKPEDIILNVLPLSFDYGLYQILMGFKIGGTVILERSFAFPYVTIAKLIQERVTGFPLVPTILAILLQMDLTKYDFSSLRYVTNTAAALPLPHLSKLRQIIPYARIYSMYGLTECKRVSYLPPEQIDLRPASVGKAMPNEEVYIVDAFGHRVGAGMAGELVVRGSNVMKGYWGLPEETEEVLKPGPIPGEKVLHTGDLFRMDEDGYLYFIGRKDDIIKTRGEKVSPKEIENILYSLDGVAEAAVFGVPDDILGQAVKAVICLKPGVHLNQKDVLRHCHNHLESFMVPKYVEFQPSLPKTPSGKIDRRLMAQNDPLLSL